VKCVLLVFYFKSYLLVISCYKSNTKYEVRKHITTANQFKMSSLYGIRALKGLTSCFPLFFSFSFSVSFSFSFSFFLSLSRPLCLSPTHPLFPHFLNHSTISTSNSLVKTTLVEHLGDSIVERTVRLWLCQWRHTLSSSI